MDNVIALYKPKGISSNKFLQEVKKVTGIKKVGHAGTLDPLAEGVLVVGLGQEGTKELTNIIKNEKEYEGVFKLGEESTTDDEEGKKTIISKNAVSLAKIKTAIKKFIGDIEQIPPVYSAIKYQGKEAYKWIRQGKTIQLKARPVHIKEIKILKYEPPFLSLRITAGSGVYIRSLARDLGKELGVGAYLFSLKRIRVGEFDLGKTLMIDQLLNLKIV